MTKLQNVDSLTDNCNYFDSLIDNCNRLSFLVVARFQRQREIDRHFAVARLFQVD